MIDKNEYLNQLKTNQRKKNFGQFIKTQMEFNSVLLEAMQKVKVQLEELTNKKIFKDSNLDKHLNLLEQDINNNIDNKKEKVDSFIKKYLSDIKYIQSEINQKQNMNSNEDLLIDTTMNNNLQIILNDKIIYSKKLNQEQIDTLILYLNNIY